MFVLLLSGLISAWLTLPSPDTSLRKLASVTRPCPELILTEWRSFPSTVPSPLTSPANIPKVTAAEARVPESPFTPVKVTVTSEPSQEVWMSLSNTVTVEPLAVVLMTLPQLVDVLSTELTVSENVKTMLVAVPRAPCRHSTPGVPLSGKSISKVPALPCFLLEAALTSVSSPPPSLHRVPRSRDSRSRAKAIL